MEGSLGCRRNRVDGEGSLPVRLAEEEAVEPAVLLGPPHLPRAVRDPKQTRDRRDDRVCPGDLEWVVGAMVIVERAQAPRAWA